MLKNIAGRIQIQKVSRRYLTKYVRNVLWNLLFAKQGKILRRNIYKGLMLLIITSSLENSAHINKILLLLNQKRGFEQNVHFMRDC